MPFWDLLRSEATQPGTGLHHGPPLDHPHLQSWDDAYVKMPVRLAVLLTRVSRPHMAWERQLLPHAMHSTYACDLGLGGHKYNVGSAVEIWAGHAHVTPALLDRARRGEPAAASPAAAPARPAALAPGAIPALRPRETLPAFGASGPLPGAPLRAATAADAEAMKRRLLQNFKDADAAWRSWTPYGN